MKRFVQPTATLLAVMLFCADLATADPPANKSAPGWVRPRLVGAASDAGGFSLDKKMLRALYPDFEWTEDQLGYLDDHLNLGDSRAAIVASVDPLVVSCYSDELDAVILVAFPKRLAKQQSLSVGDHLIASWTYPSNPKDPSDIKQGEHRLGHHHNGDPIVAEFFSSSVDKIKTRKEGVEQAEWDRVQALTPPAMKRANAKYRTGLPLYTGVPPEGLDPSVIEK